MKLTIKNKKFSFFFNKTEKKIIALEKNEENAELSELTIDNKFLLMNNDEKIEFFNNLTSDQSKSKYNISVYDFFNLTKNIISVNEQQFKYMIDYYQYKQSKGDEDSQIIFNNLQQINPTQLKTLINLKTFSIQYLSPSVLQNIGKRILLYDPLLEDIGKMRFLNEKIAYSDANQTENQRDNILKKSKKSYYLIYNSIYNRIDICEGTIHIESHLFDGYDIENVFIPSTVIDIQDNAFFQCRKLTTVSLKCQDLKSIGKSAFSDCEKLKSFVIPNSVNVIEDYTFKGCKELENIKLPATLEVIKEKAFSGCNSLTEIKLPKAIKKIGYGAFKECRNLRSVIIPGVLTIYPYEDENPIENNNENSVNNFTISEKCFSKCRELRNIIIMKNCKIIEDSAFLLCSKITSIIINLSKGTKIGNSAFKNCEQLETINFIVENGASLEIGQSTFENCKKLEKVNFNSPNLFGENCLYVKSSAFKNCECLKEFKFPENCNGDIGTNCFEGCKNLSHVILPSNITKISKSMFKDCQNLKTINLSEKEKITLIDEGAFDNCSKLNLTNLPQNLVKIGDKAFQKCSLLEIKSLPSKIEEIGERAFNECIGFIELIIPSSMKIIHKEAFKECNNLEKVTNESQSVVIEKKAFFKCPKLKEVFTEKKTGFSSQAFKDCAKGLDFFRIENEE